MIYEVNPNAEFLQQGDILKDIPFFFIPPLPLRIVRKTAEGETLSVKRADIIDFASAKDLKDSGSVEESVVVDLHIRNVILATQTCDIERRETIAVCPIYSLEEYKQKLVGSGISETKFESQLVEIKKYGLNYLFYLPPTDSLVESIVDFEYVNTIRNDNTTINILNRTHSLSHYGRGLLAHRISEFFGRPAVY
jgi:hypothetical protein